MSGESLFSALQDDLGLFAAGIVERFEGAPFRSWTPVSIALYELAKAYLEASFDETKYDPADRWEA